MSPCLSVLQQIGVILYRLFDSLWLNTDIPLCGGDAGGYIDNVQFIYR